MPDLRTFHIGDILSVTTGLLVSPRHMDGMYDLLGYMTGDELWTHQLPRACDECEPSLREQFPDLAAVVPPEFESSEQVWGWLEEQVAAHGETREVAPLAPAEHTSIDPISEFKMMRPDADVIAVAVDE